MLAFAAALSTFRAALPTTYIKDHFLLPIYISKFPLSSQLRLSVQRHQSCSCLRVVAAAAYFHVNLPRAAAQRRASGCGGEAGGRPRTPLLRYRAAPGPCPASRSLCQGGYAGCRRGTPGCGGLQQEEEDDAWWCWGRHTGVPHTCYTSGQTTISSAPVIHALFQTGFPLLCLHCPVEVHLHRLLFF